MSAQIHRTIIQVEILSQGAYDPDTLGAVHYDIVEGECSGRWTVTETTKLSNEAAANALIAQGSDPGFFGLGTPKQERLAAIADAEVARQPGLVPHHEMDYDAWLDWTGKDDSFVGDGVSVPGTEDLYGAVMRAVAALQELA